MKALELRHFSTESQQSDFGPPQKMGFDDPHQTLFDRKTLVLPDIVARSDVTPEKALKSAFDLMWQAAGFAGSWNFNSAGEWVPR